MEHKSRPLLDLLLGIVIPSAILMNFSEPEKLGATWSLILALAFPLSRGLYELVRFRVRNYIALLGFVSVLLTGGIGLLQMDTQWLAIKEAAVPALLGFAVAISAWIGRPLVRVLLYNPQLLNTDKIDRSLDAGGQAETFEARLLNATYLLSATFFFSAVMNYLLASWIVVSPAGSAAFNEELGRLTLISYPVIALPSMAMMLLILFFIWRAIRDLTGLGFDEILAPSLIADR